MTGRPTVDSQERVRGLARQADRRVLPGARPCHDRRIPCDSIQRLSFLLPSSRRRRRHSLTVSCVTFQFNIFLSFYDRLRILFRHRCHSLLVLTATYGQSMLQRYELSNGRGEYTNSMNGWRTSSVFRQRKSGEGCCSENVHHGCFEAVAGTYRQCEVVSFSL